MNPTNKRLIFLILALTIAAVVSFLTYKMVKQEPVLKMEAKVETEVIAIAMQDLPRMVMLTREDIKLVPFLKDSMPPGVHKDAEKLVGRTLITSVKQNEPILESKLVPTDAAKGGIAVLISPGKRAMSIKVDKVIGVSGFLKSGHFVDVLLSIKKPGEQAGFITKTVLENIHVLVAGPQKQKDGKQGKAPGVITLEVDLKQAEELGVAVNKGRIHLVLRNYTDKKEELTRGANVKQLLSAYTIPEETVVVKKGGEKRVVVRETPKIEVEIMNGNNVQSVKMKRR